MGKKNSEQPFRTKIKDNNSLYFVLFDSHCVSSDLMPCEFIW